jgi:large subunit ribosomal protein L31
MKAKIHPEYKEAKVICACGNTFTTRSTKPILKIELCNKCHPFFSGGERRIVDSAGQVERFKRRYRTKEAKEAKEAKEVEEAKEVKEAQG